MITIYRQIATKRQSQNQLLKWIIPAVIVIVVVGLGLYILKHNKATPMNHNSTGNHAVQPTQNSSSQTNLVSYTSNGQDLNLTFSYPSNWTVSPPTNDNTSDQTITVTSPLTSIVDASSKTVTGKAVVSIRPGSAQISELSSGKAITPQSSIQIGYAQPLASQQQYPYLSFINLAGGTDANNGFQEVMVTGQQQFSQSENITTDELSGLDPIISAGFYSCSTQACIGNGEIPLSITMDTWQNSSPFTQVLAIIQSLQLH